MSLRPKYSFVIPLYNEESTFAELVRRVGAQMEALDGAVEVILVDDGSQDRTPQLMQAQARQDPRFKIVQLARNFGHQVAITAGMDLASGDAVIIMDADLQDPPEVVGELITRWREGYEVVYAVRERRSGESLFKRITASLFYRILRRLTDVDIPADVGDFRLVDRRALQAFRSLREGHRFVRGMFSWVGFRQTGVSYKREARFAGETKYSLRKMIRLAGDAILSFSHLPLRIMLVLGLVLFAASFSVAAWATVVGTLSEARLMVVLVFGMGGLQLFFMGIMGVYLGRVYEEVKKRPIYITRALMGFDEERVKNPPAGAVWM